MVLTTLLTACGQGAGDTPYAPTEQSADAAGQQEGDVLQSGDEGRQSDTALQEDDEERRMEDAQRPLDAVTIESSGTTPAADSVPGGEDSAGKGTRDNTPVCLVPAADGTAETHNEVASVDYSNAASGYVMARYTGDCPKVKLRITDPEDTIYTYDLHGNEYEVFPFSSGDGSYDVTIYENISGTTYATCLHVQVSVTLTDEFAPFLYPNQYVSFTSDSKVVARGSALAEGADSDLEVVTRVYDSIVSSITYDYQKASDPPTGYTTDVDAILESGTGICLDYAAVMAAMLRSQRIPTRLEVGYARDEYHAWISVYIEDVGWLNGIIEFDGHDWTLIDPTFGATTDGKTLKKFISDTDNYILQKMY